MTNDRSDWKQDEWQSIHQRREKAFHTTPPKDVAERPKNLIGLALSGGGIRSALYNDGFLQGLSHRGLLRYVDYLASVSGGGYIAGHLIAQAESQAGQEKGGKGRGDASGPPGGGRAKGFHDDDRDDENQFKRWHLGRKPGTGEVDPRRLAAVGGYLSRPMEVLPAYLWSCFFSATFYIGICGILATLAALFWRSFDDPNFRAMYFEVLGIRAGNEFLIALIPAIIVLAVFVILEIGWSAFRWVIGENTWKLQQKHVTVRAWSFVALVLAFLTSIAIFLGNGTTNVQSAAGSSLYLNHYAQWLAVIAGTLQVLVFFGSDRLFRSEREDAKTWQRHLQRFIAVGVTLFLVFSMIHWMGRENISQYSNHRDPYLVVGDVSDWQTLEHVFETYEETPDYRVPSLLRSIVLSLIGNFDDDPGRLNVADNLSKELKLPDGWEQTLATRRWGLLSDATDVMAPRDVTDPTDDEKDVASPWMLEHRLLGAFHAYQLAMSDSKSPASEQPSTATDDTPAKAGVVDTMRREFAKLKSLRVAQRDQLRLWNRHLESSRFTRALLTGVGTSGSDLKVSPGLPNPIYKDVLTFLASSDFDFSKQQRKSIANAAHRIKLIELAPDAEPASSRSERLAYVDVNRLLLEALYPRAVRSKDIPSTHVVPPYDQEARRSWLGLWLLMATIGAIGGVYRHQVATVFRFYRKQLGANFLVRSHRREEALGEVQLHQLDPTRDGLPYPLMLAASLEPATVNGGYMISSRAFMFSPRYCGDLDDPNNRICTKQVALSKNSEAKSVTLADAVTLSGAAVTAFMTTNRCLSLLVDFFNTGLGMQVYRTEKTDVKNARPDNLVWLLTAGIATAFAGLIFWVMRGDWPSTVTAFALAWIIGSCVIHEKGVPHFLKMLIMPREIGPHAPKEQRERSAKSFYVADGGFTDYLGVSALLKRRCELIVVSDAGANVGGDHLGTLAKMCEKTSAELGIRFVDLDHEAPIDFGRLQFDEQRLVHQPYLCMRVRYPDATEGLLIYCQMAISDSDPIEIQQIRHRFPTFPDEPTVNQFYSEDQVSAYRMLGYHVASKLSRELERWSMGRWNASGAATAGAATAGGIKPDDVASGEVQADGATKVKNVAAVDDVTTRSGHGQKRSAPDSPEYERFQRELRQIPQPAARSARDGVPYFDVLQERLLTAYRLACYEEVTYREDDIFNEAIWPISTYAFPNLHQHVQSLRTDRDPKTFAESWLRIYEMSADVRSVYRKAVLEDINVLNTGAQSFCAALHERLAQERPSGLRCKRLLAAHLAAMATACQEVHRGRPHAAFQVGGRRKVVDLCRNLANTIVDSLPRSNAAAPDFQLREVLGNVVAEISELERSVFQGGEHVTTISFAQCVCVMWGRMARGERSCGWGIDGVAERGSLAFKTGRQTPTESRMVTARHELDRGLRRVELKRILNTLTRLWYLGYFHSDAEELLNHRAFKGFRVSGFKRCVRAMISGDDVRCARNWLQQCESHRRIRLAYQDAIAIDAKEISSAEDSKLVELWTDLHRTATSIRADVTSGPLMAAHLAALVTSYACSEKCDSLVPDVSFAPGGQDRLLDVCAEIARCITAPVNQSEIEVDDADLDELATKLFDALTRLHECKSMIWNAKAIGHFARSVINLSVAVMCSDRPKQSISLHIEKLTESHDRFTPSDGETQTKDFVDQVDQELAELILAGAPKGVPPLMQLWYVALTHRNELGRFENQPSDDDQPKPRKKKQEKGQKMADDSLPEE
ncbi:hypothetical protein NZK35_09305 [Stieleria sp. ICT_E10.1]|uniref:hypothetical protein n=1 Tax=Stieleria sedimenti TaxID=2976331 RepID=UPI00218067A2|nr:hypothetical protein [Stieleria sedimenti]MCS7466839.1 hypothetical protein [Stieleria sedimenti]